MLPNRYATMAIDFKFHLRQALGRLRRVMYPVPIPMQSRRRLHLGCGGINHPGFTNVDGIARPHVHYVQSIVRLKRFDSGSFDFVYTSHTLEHFPRSSTASILTEWHRILTPGGRLAISVPDFDKILEIYRISDGNVDDILPPLFGGQDYPFNYHFTTFNRTSLQALLLGVGFSRVETWCAGQDELHNLPDWSGRSIVVSGHKVPISLNLEAIK